jgi:hypothetical protein
LPIHPLSERTHMAARMCCKMRRKRTMFRKKRRNRRASGF